MKTTMKRAVHIDFHTMPKIDDFGANYEPSDLAEMLADAHVTYVNIFARCNLGFSYYPTKIGTPYPGITRDYLGEAITELHNRGIGVTAYVNGGINHELMNHHQEFIKITKDGRLYDDVDKATNHYFRMPCFNSGYREYLFNEIREVMEKEPDGIFVDCMIPKPCYCSNCLRKMAEKGIDPSDDAAAFKFQVDTLYEVFSQIHAIVTPKMRLYINSKSNDWFSEFEGHIELECLPTYSWGYDFFPAQAPYYRNLAPGKELVYMTGAMVTGWGDFSGYKPDAALECDVYDAMMYGYTPSVGDLMHPRDGLNRPLYKQVGKMYRYVESMEPWTEGSEAVAEAAILRNKVTSENVLTPVSAADKGAARMFCEMRLSYDVVDEDMPFDGYKLLLLPDDIRITEKLKAKLEAFEGAIISTGNSIADGSVWDFITDIAPDTNTHGFYAWGEQVYGQKYVGVKMKSEYSVSDYVEPYFNTHWDGFHGYFYVPPKDSIGCSAVAKKGNRAHVCFRLFTAYMEYGALFHKEVIESLVNEFLPERMVMTTELPTSSRVTLRKGKKGDLLQIKVSVPEHWANRGVINEHTVLPAGRKISVAGEYTAVCSLPDEKNVKSWVENGRTVIELPEITGFVPLLLKK